MKADHLPAPLPRRKCVTAFLIASFSTVSAFAQTAPTPVAAPAPTPGTTLPFSRYVDPNQVFITTPSGADFRASGASGASIGADWELDRGLV